MTGFATFDMLAEAQADRVLLLQDAASGLRAIIALDDLTLGPACGGIRTKSYPGFAEMAADAARLARAMTLKCAIAGLPGGGGKTVVLDHPGLERPAAFRRLGGFIEDLAGRYRTAGDLGTTYEDLCQVATATRFVDVSGAQLGEATARGLLSCLRACAGTRGRDLATLHVVVQGCGLIGASFARLLTQAGARVTVSDLDRAKAEALARELGAAFVDSSAIFTVDADVFAPCAVGGVLTSAVLEELPAWAICGGANNQFGDEGAPSTLQRKSIAYVPDFLASAGGVIDGLTRALELPTSADLIAKLEHTTREVFAAAEQEGTDTATAAARIARMRIAAARPVGVLR